MRYDAGSAGVKVLHEVATCKATSKSFATSGLPVCAVAAPRASAPSGRRGRGALHARRHRQADHGDSDDQSRVVAPLHDVGARRL